MQSNAPTTTSKLAGSQPMYTIACLIIFLVWTCIVPPLFSQQDVHAGLIPPANRKSAPAFQLVAENGRKMQISDYRGRVVLLNFWATDCGGCVLEIPSII